MAPALDTLSMGMSDDLEAAIAEGATIVRVGGGDIRPPQQVILAEAAVYTGGLIFQHQTANGQVL